MGLPAKNYDIVGGYNNQRVIAIDAERSVNLFMYVDPLGKKPMCLINTSGLINTNTAYGAATNGFRAQYVFLNNEYQVIGNSVYRKSATGTISFLGNINTTVGYVGVDANTFQVTFVDGVNGWVWDTMANTFTQITDTSFPPQPLDVCTLDGFTVVIHGSTNKFQISSFNQSMIWGPATDTFTADPGTNLITVANTANYATGVSVTFSTTGSLPTPLNASDTYFVIQQSGTTLKVAATFADAIAGTPIIITTPGTGTNTITSTGQLQQGEVTSHPGTLVACRTLHRRLFLFCQFFTEVWENSGIGSNLPFRRNNSSLMEYGTPAIGSISVGFDSMFFLSQDRDGLGSVMEVKGTQSIPVSNRALDFQLAQYAAAQQLTDCRSFLIKENGLIFYRMNFTEANHTYVYNVSLSDATQEQTKIWHEEEVLNGDRHPAQTHAYFNGINYVGHFSSPTLYQVDSNTYTNDGETIRRMRIGRPVETPVGYNRRRIDRFQLDLLQGQLPNPLHNSLFEDVDLYTETSMDIDTEAGDAILVTEVLQQMNLSQPFVFLSISKDGGQTFGYLVKAPMGNVGQRQYRTLWRKLGVIPRGQGFVPKIEFFNQLPFVILGAAWVSELLPE